jgi:hypothetical protein
VHFCSFLWLSLSYRGTWNEMCLSGTVKRDQNQKMFSALRLGDNFVGRMNGG